MTTDHSQLLIGGVWTAPATGNRITVRSASTEEVIGSVPEASTADVDEAVAAARRAFEDPTGWSTWDPARRAEVLGRLAEEYEKRSEPIYAAVSSQNGMPIAIARQLESFPPLLFRYYADLIRKQPAEEVRDGLLASTVTVRRSAVGVVAAIIPWNVPQSLTASKLGPGLAAGCTLVV